MAPRADHSPALPSDAEIGVLEALAAEGEALIVQAGTGGPPLRTRLLVVDPGREFLVVAATADRPADEPLLRCAEADFVVEWQEWRIAFSAAAPQAASHAGVEAVRLRFPASVSIRRRRMFERLPVAGHALRCVAYSGAAKVFEAEVTDISAGGVGLLADATGARIEPGTVLAGCRLERQGGAPLVVNLEVRHTAIESRPDGNRVVRLGCRFVNLSQDVTRALADPARLLQPS